MIKRIHIQNYKALRDVSLELSQLHVLIGPNDSGKTSILEAVSALCRSVNSPLAAAFEGTWNGLDLVWQHSPSNLVDLSAELEDDIGTFDYGLTCRFKAVFKAVTTEREWTSAKTGNGAKVDIKSSGLRWTGVHNALTQDVKYLDIGVTQRIHNSLSGVHYYRWNANFLSLPVAPDSSQNFRMDQSGFGLARCLDDILGYDRKAFDELEARFTAIFPNLRSIKLKAEPAFTLSHSNGSPVPMLQKAEGKGIHFQFASDGSLISAAQVSDGVLLVLAYLTVLYLPEPPRVLLIEEPENGIHPKRLGEVLKILRDLIVKQSKTQVILTTHSPYVLDLFEPNEVTLCRKLENGSIAVKRLSDSETVKRQMDIFTLGEIWTGEGEERIADETPQPAGGSV